MITPEAFRDLMASVCAPVAVVTTATPDGAPQGATVSAIAALSMSPPLVSVALDRASSLLAGIGRARRFAVNVLSEPQSELAVRFARRGIDRFAGVDWRLSHGLPRLEGAAGFMACDVEADLPGGDHRLLMGLIVASDTSGRPPLIYGGRTYGTHSARIDEAIGRG
ncbi:MAG: flavin reductase family protein [Hyphomicrobiales bacterium]|nr:flavin reductase family protein [Hyphomicrobiales bacterium]